MIVLGIETSCDETSVAVLKDYKIASNIVSSQIKIHETFGGVVPELASRHHLSNIGWVLQHALEKAGISADRIEGVGATYGPGLVGSLLVGLNFAKAFAFARNLPFVGINHLEAHLHSIFLENPSAELPMLAVIASGGHTSLYWMEDKNHYRMLGQTRDDAIGEAFDKVGKLLGLGYPGGPVIDRLAARQSSNKLKLTRPVFGEEGYDFSYSGLKTAVLYYVERNKILPHDGTENYSEEILEICRSFQTVAIETLVAPVRKAATEFKTRSISFSGGVACNSYLREVAHKWGLEKQLPVYFPSLQLSTDNAAMIAAVAEFKLEQGIRHGMDLNAEPNLKY